MLCKCIDAIFIFHAVALPQPSFSRALSRKCRSKPNHKTDNPSTVRYLMNNEHSPPNKHKHKHSHIPKNMQTKQNKNLKNDREIIQICVFFLSRYFHRFPTFRHTKTHFIECLRFNGFHAMHLKVLEMCMWKRMSASELVSLCERAHICSVKNIQTLILHHVIYKCSLHWLPLPQY